MGKKEMPMEVVTEERRDRRSVKMVAEQMKPNLKTLMVMSQMMKMRMTRQAAVRRKMTEMLR